MKIPESVMRIWKVAGNYTNQDDVVQLVQGNDGSSYAIASDRKVAIQARWEGNNEESEFSAFVQLDDWMSLEDTLPSNRNHTLMLFDASRGLFTCDNNDIPSIGAIKAGARLDYRKLIFDNVFTVGEAIVDIKLNGKALSRLISTMTSISGCGDVTLKFFAAGGHIMYVESVGKDVVVNGALSSIEVNAPALTTNSPDGIGVVE